MRAVDTNLLVRLLVRDDAAQVDAAEDALEQGAWVSHLVLPEARRLRERQPGEFLGSTCSRMDMASWICCVTLQDADVIASALAHFRARPSLGFSDCLVLEIARKAGHQPLGTFDKSLARLDGACAV